MMDTTNSTSTKNDPSSQRDLSQIDKTILDNFYKLVHTEPNVRITAATSTYKILFAMQKKPATNKNPHIFNEHLNYCVERLVGGLASSRALARRGYAMLLLELLKKWPVSTERLLSISQQKFSNISSDSSKDSLIGYYLLIEVILESGNHKKTKQNTIQLERVYKLLMQLRSQKSYMDLPVSRLLVRAKGILYEYMLADIPHAIFGSDAKITHSDLLLMALCDEQQSIRQLANLSFDDLLNLCSPLLNDRLLKKPLHPVWFEFSRLVIRNFKNDIGRYVELVINRAFFKPNHNELASLGLNLIASLLIQPNSEERIIKLLLSPHIVKLLIVSIRSKNSLCKACNEFFDIITKGFKANLEASQQWSILSCLVEVFPGSITFDDDSKSKSISNLLNNCHLSTLNQYIALILLHFDKKMTLEESKRVHLSCAKQLAYVVHRPAMNGKDAMKPIMQNLCKFLIVNSIFFSVNPLAVDREFWTTHRVKPVRGALDSSVKEGLKNAYHSVMLQFVSCFEAETRCDLLIKLINFIDTLITRQAVEFPPELGDVHNQWRHFYVNLKKLNTQARILFPITSLYCLYGLQVVEHGLDCKNQIEDLAQAAEDAIRNDPNDGSWADILTDQIIAILSATQCNPWIRKLCVSIFGSLLPHITETTIDLLCDALKSGQDDEILDEEEDMEDDNIDEEMEGDDECENMLAKETNDGNASDEEMNDKAIENFPKDSHKKRAARKRSLSQTEEDDDVGSEEEYLDDEQMMKLDNVIADMFKLNRVGKKKKPDISFKLRLLDLIKKLLTKKHNDSEVVAKILATIVPMANRSRKSPEMRPIADKITKMIPKRRCAMNDSKSESKLQIEH